MHARSTMPARLTALGALACTLFRAALASADGPPSMTSGGPAVQVPQAANASGTQSAPFPFAWADLSAQCTTFLSACNLLNEACNAIYYYPYNPYGSSLSPDTPPVYEACNSAAGGMIAIQSCDENDQAQLSNTFCKLASPPGDVAGDGALGFDIAMPPFQGYDATYDLTVTANLTVEFYESMQDTGWPFSSVAASAFVAFYVYDVGTGAVVADASTIVYTASAYGPVAGVESSQDFAPLSSPLTTTIAASAGHTYQVWLWAEADGNAWLPDGASPNQYVTVKLAGVDWNVAAVPPAASARPAVTGMSPAVGSSGSTVTLTGTNFSAAYPPTVSFGGAASPNVSCPSSSICYATVPSGGADFVEVTAAFAPSFSQDVGQFFYQECKPYAGTCGGAVEVQCRPDPAGYPIQVTFSEIGSAPLTEQLPVSGWAEDLGGTISVETCTLTPAPECAPPVEIVSNPVSCYPVGSSGGGGGGGGGGNGGGGGVHGCVGPCPQ